MKEYLSDYQIREKLKSMWMAKNYNWNRIKDMPINQVKAIYFKELKSRDAAKSNISVPKEIDVPLKPTDVCRPDWLSDKDWEDYSFEERE